MKIAIMQPYIFPYIGYFQLMQAVEKFVFYDDVNFIKRGWVNRNRILVNGSDYLFSVPLRQASQNNLISETYIDEANYPKWKEKFIQTLSSSYKKAPFFIEVHALLMEALENPGETISDLAISSNRLIAKHLGIGCETIISSGSYQNRQMGRKERLIDICKAENCNEYVNAIGGMELYQKGDFAAEGIALHFLKTGPVNYVQFKNDFVPWLSVIDVMMFNEVTKIQEFLNRFELI